MCFACLVQGSRGGRDAGQQLAVSLLHGAEQTSVRDAVRSADVAASTVHGAGAGAAPAVGDARVRLSPPTVSAPAGRRLPVSGPPAPPATPPTAAPTATPPPAAAAAATTTTGTLPPVAGRILPVRRGGSNVYRNRGSGDHWRGDNDDPGGVETAQAGTRTRRLFHTLARADAAAEDRRRRSLDGVRLAAVTPFDGRRRLGRRVRYRHGGRSVVVPAVGHVARPFPGPGQGGHGPRRPDDGNVESQSTVVGLLFRHRRPAKGARRGHARRWRRQREQLLWTTDAPYAR